jgi:ribosomal protein S27E
MHIRVGELLMNSACPNCGVVYTFTSQCVGQNFSCRKCGTALVLDSGGLHVANVSSPVPPAVTPANARGPSAGGFRPNRWNSIHQIGVLGLVLTLVGAGFAILGGLLALMVFLAGGDTTSKGVVGAIGLYFRFFRVCSG